MTTSLEGLDLDALDRHLQSVGIARTGELRAELISGGRSNLTFLVFDDASKWVLRRPPLHGLTPSAHDMAREYKVVAALQDTPVPVAHAVTMRNDDSVLGAPFQMVAHVPGRRGTLLIAHPELFDERDPAHVAAVERLRNALEAAGVLVPAGSVGDAAAS